MIRVSSMAAQGDVLFRRVASLPRDAREQPRDDKLIVAHSETGHHHAIHASGVTLYIVDDPMVCYLKLEAAHADVVHERAVDTHETLRLLGGEGGSVYYEVRRQREHAPDGERAARD